MSGKRTPKKTNVPQMSTRISMLRKSLDFTEAEARVLRKKLAESESVSEALHAGLVRITEGLTREADNTTALVEVFRRLPTPVPDGTLAYTVECLEVDARQRANSLRYLRDSIIVVRK
jgi:hypothetical protein